MMFVGTYATISLVVVIAFVCAVATIRRLLVSSSSSPRNVPPLSSVRGVKDHTTVSIWVSLLDSFDLAASCRRLVAMKGDRSGPLASLNGVRVLSMALVVLGHSVIFANPIPGVINIVEAILPPVSRRINGVSGAVGRLGCPLPFRHCYLQNGVMSTAAFQVSRCAFYARAR